MHRDTFPICYRIFWTMAWILLIQLTTLLGYLPEASGQTWRPTRNIEIVTGTGAGSDLDRAARAIQKIAQDNSYFTAGSIVLNKTGANSAIAWGYVQEKKGQGEVVAISSPPLVTSPVLGSSKLTYRDLTPLAKLYDVYMCLVVRADSPITSIKDVLQQAASNKSKGSWALTGGAGSIPHILLAQLISEGKIQSQAVPIVHYKAAGEMMAALLGGHIDLVSSTIPNVMGAFKNGQIRILAVASPNRLSGALANIPTLKEQGVDLVSTNWRGVIGPPGMTKDQIAFWDTTLEIIIKSDEWKKGAQSNFWETNYLNSTNARAFLDTEEKQLSVILKELDVKNK